jgi:hypothetical protein
VAALSAREFLRRALLAVAARAESRVRPQIPSATLQRALNTRLEETLDGMVALVGVPHYWAVYLHDGRAGFGKSHGFLVFFKNPAEDPRIQGGYPERASQIRRLSPAEWRRGLERNRQHLAAGGDPFDAPMIVVRRVGPAQGAHWFTRGMAGFIEEAGQELATAFDAHIQGIVDESGMTERSVATGLL